jgi:hypothetical protein
MSRRPATLLFTAILFGASAVAVFAPAHAQARPRLTVPTRQGTPAEACRFRVTVRSKANGRPIAKAAVRFLWPEIKRHFETDANGIALVEGLGPQEHAIQVRANGYAADLVVVAGALPGTTSDLVFALSPGGQIRGTVRDADGKPIGRIGVTLRFDPILTRAVRQRRSELRQDQTQADSEGRFVFDNVPVGEKLELLVGRPNQWQRKPVLLTPQETNVTADVSFGRQAPGGSIVVHVTGPDHKPLAGAQVTNPGASPDWSRQGTTDANGDCRLDDVYEFGRFSVEFSPSGYRLYVRAKGCAPQDVLGFKRGTSANPTHIAVELEQGHSVRGRVMLTNGRPAANIHVAFDKVQGLITRSGETLTDAQGRFAFDSLPLQSVWKIDPPPGYTAASLGRMPLDRKTETILTLDTASVVKGQVVDEAGGKAVVGYRMRVFGGSFRRRGETAESLALRLRRDGRIILDPAGRFQLGDLAPHAQLRLRISAAGYIDQWLERVSALPDDQFRPLVIRLRKIDARDLHTVSGKLVDAAGKPIAGADVRLWTSSSKPTDPTNFPFIWDLFESGLLDDYSACQQFLAGVTNKAGEFAFSQVRVAGYGEIVYWGEGIAAGRHAFQVAPDSPPLVPLTIKASAPARLIVEVDRQAWPRAERLRVYGNDSSMRCYRTLSVNADHHRFTIENLPPGSVEVSLWSLVRKGNFVADQRAPLSSRQMNLKAGETTTIRFDKP